MDERVKFWSDPSRWPVDRSGSYVFLAAAVLEVGPAMSPEWHGDEAVAPDLLAVTSYNPTMPDVAVITYPLQPWKREVLHNLLRKHRPEFGREPIQYGPFGRRIPDFSEEELSAASRIAHDIDKVRREQKARLSRVTDAVATAIVQGKLEWGIKPVRGGAVTRAVSSHAWNTNQLDALFYWCQMRPSDPFGPGVGGDDYQHIFISRASLDAFVKSLASQTPVKVHAGGRKRFADWLHAEIAASTDRKTLNKQQITSKAAEFSLSGRQAEQARSQVLANFPDEVRKVWTAAGAPLKAAAAKIKAG